VCEFKDEVLWLWGFHFLWVVTKGFWEESRLFLTSFFFGARCWRFLKQVRLLLIITTGEALWFGGFLARIGEALWFEGFLARIGDVLWFLSRYSFEVYILCVCTHLVLLFKLKFCALRFLCIVQYATVWGTRIFQPHHNLAFKENKKVLVVFLYFALVVIRKRFWSPHMECIIPILLISLKCHSLSLRKYKRGMYIYMDTCTWFTK
jgi:hypothetical protein